MKNGVAEGVASDSHDTTKHQTFFRNFDGNSYRIRRISHFFLMYLLNNQYYDKESFILYFRSFPVLYWDKFVKKRVRTKYSEQFEFDAISNTLGMEKSALASQSEEGGGIITLITSIDWRYQMWKVGITMTDNVRKPF